MRGCRGRATLAPGNLRCGAAKTWSGALSGPRGGHYTIPNLWGIKMPLIPSSFVEKSWREALSRLEAGRLEFVAPNGELTVAGGKLPGPEARFHIKDWDVLRRILARGDIGLG